MTKMLVVLFFIYLLGSLEAMPVVAKFKNHKRMKAKIVKHAKNSSSVNKLGKTSLSMRNFLDAIQKYAARAKAPVVKFLKGVYNLLEYIYKSIEIDLSKVFDQQHSQGWLMDLINGLMGEFSLKIKDPQVCMGQNTNSSELSLLSSELQTTLGSFFTKSFDGEDQETIIKENDLMNYAGKKLNNLRLYVTVNH